MSEEKKNNKKYRIATTVILVRETGNIFVGCESSQQRQDVRLCDLKHCSSRKKCEPYKKAKELKRELGMITKRRRKSVEEEESFDIPERRKRRHIIPEPEVKTKSRRKKFFNPIEQATEPKRRRRRK